MESDIMETERPNRRLAGYKPREPSSEDNRLARVVATRATSSRVSRDLLAYCIMPSFCMGLQPREEWVKSLPVEEKVRSPRERIMHSLKRQTARDCNRLLGKSGAFWQHESYDHWIRDLDELERIIAYVENNPVKARLVGRAEDWKCSSAHDRMRLKIPRGPLLDPTRKIGSTSF